MEVKWKLRRKSEWYNIRDVVYDKQVWIYLNVLVQWRRPRQNELSPYYMYMPLSACLAVPSTFWWTSHSLFLSLPLSRSLTLHLSLPCSMLSGESSLCGFDGTHFDLGNWPIANWVSEVVTVVRDSRSGFIK